MDRNNFLIDLENRGISQKEYLDALIETLDLRDNPFHPLVFINGEPEIEENVYIGLFSEINAKHAKVRIGKNCDIASFVSINVADSHKYTIGIADQIERRDIVLEENVFVGSHSFIGGGNYIGHHSVVAAGTILINKGEIPSYSLISGNPVQIKPGYFKKKNDCSAQ